MQILLIKQKKKRFYLFILHLRKPYKDLMGIRLTLYKTVNLKYRIDELVTRYKFSPFSLLSCFVLR